MLRKLLIAMAALGTFGVIVATPALVARQALAAGPKCLNKANKYAACTDKVRAKTQRKKSQLDALPRIKGIESETEARRGPRLRAR